jgi:hypothetical protein
MCAALAVNLAVIGLVEMLAVAFGEEREEEGHTRVEWAIPRLNRLRLRSTTITETEEAQTARGRRMSNLYPTPSSSEVSYDGKRMGKEKV